MDTLMPFTRSWLELFSALKADPATARIPLVVRRLTLTTERARGTIDIRGEGERCGMMKFQITLTPSAEEDLRYFRIREQRTIVDAILIHLGVDAGTASRRRRKLRPNPLAPWELRVGSYRAFYEIEGEAAVKVVAIGWKEHNTLFIRGKVVEL